MANTSIVDLNLKNTTVHVVTMEFFQDDFNVYLKCFYGTNMHIVYSASATYQCVIHCKSVNPSFSCYLIIYLRPTIISQEAFL